MNHHGINQVNMETIDRKLFLCTSIIVFSIFYTRTPSNESVSAVMLLNLFVNLVILTMTIFKKPVQICDIKNIDLK